ncbi:MAG: hypothetical protein A3J48_00685 [Candidatus Doudnabacteria bacterium RIFCSPHIGHO2_02_FULL_46_11]|uniref:Cob(I)yrinic acid a,c-diamide adenosyltransferase n=1 Tax=Candidatus Doudnabacteria bacterium RIFCSPHIGHO2_02_FULL_46_11 TaxID=1817832 RepID=A0A1F5P586_9BACT|nr:MAG: hypothetical protein A3J48_00685 [Candidatus Doudnabacteria bacterium RIFCSPHIGHO2_02_FULL_46_11]
MANKGLTIIYIGEGKGKTTAAMGLGLRAVGTGLDVGVLQFVKGEWPTGEKDFAQVFQEMKVPKNKMLGRFEFVTAGRGFVKILGDKKPLSVHKKAAALGLKQARQMFKKFDVVILDELLSAYESKLIKLSDVEKIISAKPKDVHLVITGHYLPAKLKIKADLITEMKMIKHPFYKGILAQKGVDY